MERPPARHHLVDEGTERKDVRARVGLLALDLFGRHVLKRAQDGALRRQRRAHRRCRREVRLKADPTNVLLYVGSGFSRTCGLGEPEIEQLRARLREHHIARLQIAMRNTRTMSRVERAGDFDGDLECVCQGEAGPYWVRDLRRPDKARPTADLSLEPTSLWASVWPSRYSITRNSMPSWRPTS